ncbi:MAG: Uncharacterized protein Greene041619_443, partial [Candidatus Peregrinibacteria bacterium Greene0416_19]
VVAIMGVLASLVLQALNPRKHLGAARDVQRLSDVNAIINAVHQYALDHDGKPPPAVPVGVSKEICVTGAVSCVSGVDLSAVVGAYIVNIPVDPSVPKTGTGSRYFIMEAANGLLTVSAPHAEQQAEIKAVR